MYTTLDVPGSTDSYANGINGAGAIVGGYTDQPGRVHGFLLQNGTYQTFNDPSAVKGTHPHAVNASGDIVGGYLDGQGDTHAFLLHDGAYTTIDLP